VGAHGSLTNPLSGLYRTEDGRYISLVMLQPARYWAEFCEHIDRPELIDDPRFATGEQLAANTAAAVELIKEVIAGRTLADWSQRFATLSGPWAPVQDTVQATADTQVRANDYVQRAGESELIANPVQFDVTAPELRPAPEFAAQTDEILQELGMDWDKIIALKEAGAVT
jgi:crotonobetainyl-CoA:carnitine CoA-transferase CaiB-like acyl-CoA transferase